MPRVKRGTTSLKHRRSVLKKTKGYRFGRGNKEREAKVAIAHAGRHAYRHRRLKKRTARGLWQIKISAATRPLGLSYSRFIAQLKKKQIGIDRKILADLAENQPETFTRLVGAL